MHAIVFVLALLTQDTSVAVKQPSTALDRFIDQTEQQRTDVDQAVAESREQKYEEREFIARFNDLVAALTKFSDKYKKQHTIDVKTMLSIRKAYQNLERSDAWFKTAK